VLVACQTRMAATWKCRLETWRIVSAAIMGPMRASSFCGTVAPLYTWAHANWWESCLPCASVPVGECIRCAAQLRLRGLVPPNQDQGGGEQRAPNALLVHQRRGPASGLAQVTRPRQRRKHQPCHSENLCIQWLGPPCERPHRYLPIHEVALLWSSARRLAPGNRCLVLG